MSIEMVPIEIIGLKKGLPVVLSGLRELGSVHIDNVSESHEVIARPLTLDPAMIRRQEDLALLSARIDGLLVVLKCHLPPVEKRYAEIISQVEGSLEEAEKGVEKILPQVNALTKERDNLQAELGTLPLYETTLRKLLPFIPPTAHEPGNMVVGVLVNRANIGVLDLLGNQIVEATHGEASLAGSDVDDSTRAMLIVVPRKYESEVEVLLGQKDVSRLRLPPELGNGLPDEVIAIIQKREHEIPQELKRIDGVLQSIAQNWCSSLEAWKEAVRKELEGYQVLSRFGETDSTFVLVGWVPKSQFQQVKDRLEQVSGEMVYVQQKRMLKGMESSAPVILNNLPPVRPFESLIKMLELPRYKHIDPTWMMALFLPIFFGLMLGDIGYGVIILAISLLMLRKYRQPFARDLLTVIAIGSGWAIFFGILFGEVFGTMGESLGLHPIWIARDSADDVIGFLLMTVAIGAGHVTLGLVLGVWEAIRDRSRTHLLERGGMLVGLIGLFLLTGVLVDFLPEGFMTPAVAGVIIGIVLLSASLGWIGILMGPIEFIGLIGNVLSYLRIAAIGLASVYLAKVANEMAGMVGSLVVGLILAVLIHALNLVLGVFSPTIHSLRLHYVEFFRKFYEGGGRPYEPFGKA